MSNDHLPTSHSDFSFMEKLEDRVLFDAVPDGSFIVPAGGSGEADIAQHQTEQIQSADELPRQLIVIDAGVDNSKELLKGILASNPENAYEVRYLSADQNGIEQISEILGRSGDHPYSAVHVISHGEPGSVQLGNSVLSLDTLRSQADLISGWGAALSADADLLFYGCDLAGNVDGQLLTNQLAAITGADVAASDDATGSAELGGDWVLERHVGSIEATSFVVQSWGGILATAVDDQAADTQADFTGTTTGNVRNNDTHTNGVITNVFGFPGEVGQPFALNYGTLTLNANGSYAYDIDETDAAVIGLRVGEVLQEIISYEITDANSSSDGILTFDIIGVEDELLAADDFGAVTTVTSPTISANIVSDPGAGFDVFDRGLSIFAWEDLYAANQEVNGTSRTVDGITVDLTTADPDGIAPFNPRVSYAQNGGHAGYLQHQINGGNATTSSTTTQFDFSDPVFSLSFILADIDSSQFATPTWQDQFNVVGTLNGAPVGFDALSAGSVIESPADTFYGTGSAPTVDATGNVNVVFTGPVDQVIVTYSQGPDSTGTSGIIGAISDLNWQPPIDVEVARVDGSTANVGIPYTGTYGTFNIQSNGSYTYTVDDSNPDVIALGAGETLVDTVPYTLQNTLLQQSSATVNITITGINEAPTLDLDLSAGGTGYGNTFTEAGGGVNISDTDVLITDVDNPDTGMESLTITPGGIVDGNNETLTFNGDGATRITFGMGTASADQQITVGGTVVNVAFDGTSFTLTNNAGGDISNGDIQALIAGIDYNNTGPAVTAGNRTLALTVFDGIDSSNTAVSTINVVTSPQSAEWSITGDTSVDEGNSASYTVALSGNMRPGETARVNVSIADISTTSADYATFSNAVNAAVAAYTGDGTLAWNGTALTYTAGPTGNMAPLTFTLAAINDAVAETPEYYSVNLSAPTSTTGQTIGVDAVENLVNTQISGQAIPVSGTEDMDLVFSSGNGNAIPLFSESDGDPQATVTLAIPAALGTLTLSGTAGLSAISGNGTEQVTVTGPVSAINAAFEGLTLSPTADFNNTAALPLTVDTVFTASTNTVSSTIDVTIAAVDDTATDNLITGADTPITFNVLTGTNGATADNFEGTPQVTSVTQPANGAVTFNAAGNLTFTPTSGFEGTTSFTYTVTSPAGVTETETVNITVLALPMIDLNASDGATNADFTNTFTEGGSPVKLSDVDPSVTDSDSTRLTELTISPAGIVDGSSEIITFNGDGGTSILFPALVASTQSIAVNGQSFNVDYDGTDFTITAVGDMLLADLESLIDGITYENINPSPSTTNRTFTFQATDGTGSSNIATSTISITPASATANWGITGASSVDEGGNANYTISLTGGFTQAGETAYVDLGIANIDTTSADYANFVTAVNTAVAAYGGPGALMFDGTRLTFTSAGTGTMTALNVTLGATNDATIEGPEQYSIALANAGSSTGETITINPAQTDVQTTINDTQGVGGAADGPALWNISGPVSGDEGQTLVYTVSLGGSLSAGESASVVLDLNDVTTNTNDYADFIAAVTAAAAANSDVSFNAATGTLTYTAPSEGAGMADLLIQLPLTNDAFIEGPENYTAQLSAAASSTGIAVGIDNASVNTTISDTQGPGGIADGPAEFSITGPTNRDEGGTAQYTVALGGTYGAGETASVLIDITNVDTNSADYANFVAAVTAAAAANPDVSFNAGTGRLTYTAPSDGASMADLSIDLAITDDADVEGPEDFQIALTSAASTTGIAPSISATAGSVTTTINDTQGPGGAPDSAQWSITGDTNVDEGGTANYVVALGAVLQTGETASVQLAISNFETTSADYAAFAAAVQSAVSSRPDLSFNAGTGVLTYTSTGSAMADLNIALGATDDTFVEGSERYQIALSNSSSSTGASIGIDAVNDDVVTIVNDTVGDGGITEEVIWSFGVDQTVPEGNNATYTLALTNGILQAGESVSVNISIADVDTTSADYASFNAAVQAVVDNYGGSGSLTFDAATGTITFISAGSAMTDLSIALGTVDDSVAEGPEDYRIQITGAASSTGALVSIDAANDDSTTTIDDTTGPGADQITWSITGAASVDEGGTAAYTVALAGVLDNEETASVTLDLSNIETNSSDYAAFTAAVQNAVSTRPELSFNSATGVLTYAGTSAPMTDLVINLDAVDDLFVEGPERYSIGLSTASSSGPLAAISATENSVTTTINDTIGDGGATESVQWAITGPATVAEGAPIVYSVDLANVLQNGETSTVEISLSDLETVAADRADFNAAVSTAVASYTGPGAYMFDAATGTLTFASDGNAAGTLSIDLGTVDDSLSEGPERLTVALSNPGSTTGAVSSVAAASSVTTTIADNDSAQWSITGPIAGDEGTTATYTVALSGTWGAGEIVTVDLDLANIATSNNDYGNLDAAVTAAAAANPNVTYNAATGALTYTSPADGSSMTDLVIDLALTDDAFNEGPENYSIGLSNAATTSGGTVTINAGASSVETLINDTQGPGGVADGPGQWSITGPTNADEGTTAQYTIALSGVFGAGESLTVDLSLSDLDTTSNDYADLMAALTTAAAANPNVTFNSAAGTLTYTSPADGASMTDLVIDLDITNDAWAEGPEDFNLALSNAASSTGAAFGINAVADDVTTTIDDTQGPGGIADGPVEWNISGPVSTDEGDTAQYTVSLSGSLGDGEVVSVDIDLNDIATTPADYANAVAAVTAAAAANPNVMFNATTGTLTYTSPADGSTMADLIIDLPITDDAFVEGPEDFSFDLSNDASTTGIPTGINSASVATTINDTQGPAGAPDGPAVWSVSGPATTSEGATPQFTVALAGTFGAGEVVDVVLDLANIDTNSSDYGDFLAAVNTAVAANPNVMFNAGTGTLTYTSPADGSSMMDVVVDLPISVDGLTEGDEDFSINLSGATSSTGVPVSVDPLLGTVVTTIVDADAANWSISGPVSADEGTTAQYTIALSGGFDAGETATVDLAATNIDTTSSDYGDFIAAVTAAASANPDVTFNTTTGTLTYTSPANGSSMADLLVDLPITDDLYSEGPEDFALGLSNATSSVVGVGIATPTVTTTINDTQGPGGIADGPAVWDLTGPTNADEGSSAVYTLALGGSLGAGESVSIDLGIGNVDTNSGDYASFAAAVTAAAAANPDVTFSSTTGTLTYTAPSDGAMMADLLIDLSITDDMFSEGPEDFAISITGPASTDGLPVTIANALVTTTINDTQGPGGVADGPGEWQITGPTSGDEGTSATYTVALSGAYGVGESVSVDIGLANIDTNSSDYGNLIAAIDAAVAADPMLVFNSATGTLTWTASSDGATFAGVDIALPLTDDAFIEGPEDFAIQLTNPNATAGMVSVNPSANSVTTTINDTQGPAGAADGPAVWNIAGPISGDEGATAQYTVSLAGVFGAGEIATVEISAGDITTNSSDYASFLAAVTAAAAANPDVTFDAATTELTYTAPSDSASMMDLVIDLGLTDDAVIEGPESFAIELANAGSTTAASVTIGTATVTTTINDTQGPGGVADGPGQWSITGPTSADEGSTAQYTIMLSGSYAAGGVTTVDLDLSDLTTNSNDYADVVAAVSAAAAANPDVMFNATTGTLTYTAPTEGSSMTDLVINLGLTDDAWAEGPEDFNLALSSPTTTAGTVNVDPTSADVTTTIDDTQGPGGIADGPVEWNISGPVSTDEGDTAQYTVSLSGSLGDGEVVSVDIDLNDIATTPADYANAVAAVTAAAAANPNVMFDAGTGTLTYTSPADGSSMADLIIDLPINDDAFVEGPEDFSFDLSNEASTTGIPTGINSASVATTINDTQGPAGAPDGPAVWSVSGPATTSEGATPQFTVALSGTFGAGEVVDVVLDLTNIDTNSGDYGDFLAAVNTAVAANPNVMFNATTGTLTYTSPADGSSMMDVVVDLPISVDGLTEGDEDFSVNLSAASSTTGVPVSVDPILSTVVTTIVDADAANWSISGPVSIDEGSTARFNIMLGGSFNGGETATVDLSISNIDTTSADYGDFIAAVTASAAANPDVTFNAATGALTYTSPADGSSMTDLIVDLPITNDAWLEGAEDFQLALANPVSSGVTVGITNASVTTTINDTQGPGGIADGPAVWDLTGPTNADEGASAVYTLALGGALGAGESVSIDLGIGNVDTNSSDYASFAAAVTAAAAANPDVTFNSTTGALTYTAPSDGAMMADLLIDLSITNDTFSEGPEDFAISITGASSTDGLPVTVANALVTTTINDTQGPGGIADGPGLWQITGPSNVDEGDTAQYNVALTGTWGAGEVVTVDIDLADISTNGSDYGDAIAAIQTAAAANPDVMFDAVAGTLTYTAPSDGATMTALMIDLPIVDDTDVEGSEQYTLALTNATSSTNANVGINATSSSVTTSINDTQGIGGALDAATWSIDGATSVDEGGTATYTVALGGTLAVGETATVELTLADIDTTSADYASFNMAVTNAVAARPDLTFDAVFNVLTYTGDGNPMTDLVIRLDAVDDPVIEGVERYQILLSNSGSTTGASTLIDATQNEVTTNINDTVGDGGALEQAVWSFGADQTVLEGSAASYVLALNGVLEAGESVSVQISIANIETNSGDYADFVAAVDAAVTAYAGPGMLTFNTSTGAVTFVSDGNAMADLPIDLGTVNDVVAEGLENFRIQITGASSSTGVGVAIDATQDDSITTIDDQAGADADQVVWSVTGSNSVDEGGTASYNVSLAGLLANGQTVSVELMLADVETDSADYASFMTAVADAVAARPDLTYDALSGVLTYTGDGSAMPDLTIDLDASDDTFVEGPERYSISLANENSSNSVSVAISATENSVLTTINDTLGDAGPNESAQWSISGATSVNEGSAIGYVVSLGGVLQSGEAAEIQIGLTDLETTGADYDDFITAVSAAVATYAGPGMLMFDGASGTLTFFSDGNAMADLPITLGTVDDVFSEGNERLSVALSNPSSTTGALVETAPPTSVTTTIVDNDVAQWSITGPATIDEGGTATYTVNLLGGYGAGEMVSVDIDLGDITTNASDYGDVITAVTTAANGNPDVTFDAANGRLTYTAPSDGASMASLMIDLPISDDGFVEGAENFSIGLFNASTTSGSIVNIDATQASVTTVINDTQGIGGIADGPGEWALTGPMMIDEGATAIYTVTLSEMYGAGEIVSVQINVADIDTNSADYGDFTAAVTAAAAANPDVMFDASTMTLTFTSPSDGATMTPLLIDLSISDDPLAEGPEDYQISLAAPNSTTGAATALSAQNSVTTTINDTQGDGGAPDAVVWSINGSTDVAEGGNAIYTLRLSGVAQAGQVVSVDLAIGDIDTTSADYGDFATSIQDAIVGRSDLSFNAATGTLTYSGSGAAMEDLQFTLPALLDNTVETPEDYVIGLSAPTSPTGASASVDPTMANVTTTIDSRDTNTGNSPPIATDDNNATTVNVPVGGELLSNDGDPDGDTITISTTPVTQPNNGSVTINNDGTFVYIPDNNFVGVDTFVYEIMDPTGNVDTATVTIDVRPDNGSVNDPPTARDDSGVGQKNVPISGDLLANDNDIDGDPLTVNTTPVSGPNSGTVTINPDGTYLYFPNNDFVGNDRFTYEICDDGGACDTATVYLTVFDNPPVAGDDFNNTNVDTPVMGNVLTNDSDPNPDDDLTVNSTPVVGPVSGTVMLNPDGSYTYTPNLGFTGTDSFEYEVCDEGGNCTTALVTIEVRDTTPNNPPNANDDSATTFTDMPVGGSVLSNDSDPDGDPITVNTTPMIPPANGTVTINPDGTYLYTPDPGFNGMDSFAYEITDDQGAFDLATVNINVVPDTNPGNDPPIANNDMASGTPNRPVNGNLLANDSEPNGDPIIVTLTPTLPPTNGTVTINPDGTYTYTPNPGFIGMDSFIYEICDDQGACANAQVTITIVDVPPPNAPPIANQDSASTLEDVPVSGSLMSNDGDPDGDVITINTTPVTPPSNGMVVINSDGTFTYTPDAGFTGMDSFIYEITDPSGASDTATATITVQPDSNGTTNDPPIANSDAGVGQKNTPVTGNLLLNDSDPNGDPLTLNPVPIVGPTNGTLTINPDGTFTYTPDDDFIGNDSFIYEICDDSGACDQATAVITVFDSTPVAVDDFGTTIVDTSVSGNVLSNDTNNDVDDDLTVNTTPVSQPTYGSVVLQPDGTFTYTPNPGYVGSDTFEYEVCDEGGNCDIGRVTIEVRDTVTAGNNPPVANNDSATVFQGGSVSSSLISNDGDPDGDPITVNTTPVSPPANGTLMINPDGSYVYTPDPTYSGTDSFVYEICDDQGACATAIVSITVRPDLNGPGNDPPIGGDDSIIGQKNALASGNLLSNDSDPNGDPITINTTPVTPPTNGTLMINPDGTFTYIPNEGFSGNDSFQYEICDDSGACDTVTAVVTIFNEPPVAANDEYAVIGDSINGTVVENDTDINGDPLAASLITPPQHGVLTLNGDGTFTYTPGPTYTGNDSFTYEICDDSGVCSSATVTLFSPFAFDSFTNQAFDEVAFERDDRVNRFGRERLLSERLSDLATEPILAGYAAPGSILVGRLYDKHGALVGETTTRVNQAGNWVMHFFDCEARTDYVVMIEHIATEEVSIGNHHFRLTPDTYRSLQLGANHTQAFNVGSIMSAAPSTSLMIWHNQNVNPLKFQ